MLGFADKGRFNWPKEKYNVLLISFAESYYFLKAFGELGDE